RSTERESESDVRRPGLRLRRGSGDRVDRERVSCAPAPACGDGCRRGDDGRGGDGCPVTPAHRFPVYARGLCPHGGNQWVGRRPEQPTQGRPSEDGGRAPGKGAATEARLGDITLRGRN